MAATILKSGQPMPLIGLGTFPGFEAADTSISEVVEDALEVGYRHIDTAFAYGNEAEVGEAVKRAMTNLKLQRNDVFVANKLWNEYHNPRDVEAAARKSLENLGLDYIDLYLMHWPMAFKPRRPHVVQPVDFSSPFEYDTTHPNETWRAMERLVDLGLVKNIGVSNFNEGQLKSILEECSIAPVVNQVECHPYLSQEPMLKFCRDAGISLVAYSPLGCRDRIWRHQNEKSSRQLMDDLVIKEIGLQCGKTPAQVMLRWQIQRGVAVIPRTRCRAHLRDNFSTSSPNWRLPPEAVEAVNSLNRNLRLYEPLVDLGEGRLRPWAGDHAHYPFKSDIEGDR